MIRKLLFLSIAVLTLSQTASAMVVRHDRDDAQYKRLGTDYPMVCRVGDGMGTLIDSLWVITTGYVAQALPQENAYVSFGRRRFGVDKVFVHPDFTEVGKPHDLALIRLQAPFADVILAQPYRGSDEIAETATLVGDGQRGDGLTGLIQGRRIYRAAHNVVDSVSSTWLRFTFNAPPEGDSLEGIGGPGDVGGPAILEKGDSLYLLGVNSYTQGGASQYLYGTQEFYTRISTELAWIDGTMSKNRAVAAKPKTPAPSDQVVTPVQAVAPKDTNSVPVTKADDARLIAVLGALVAATDSQSAAKFRALFSAHFLAEYSDSGRAIDKSHASLVKAVAKHGAILGFHKLSKTGMRVPDSQFPLRPVTFHFADGAAGFVSLSVDHEGKIDSFSLFLREGICKDGLNCKIARTLAQLSGGS